MTQPVKLQEERFKLRRKLPTKPWRDDAFIISVPELGMRDYSFLCVGNLLEYVELPTNIRTIEIVYSNKKHEHSFRINRLGQVVSLLDVPLYYAFERLGQSMFSKGLRYARIEY